jgi:hypothetical protein
LAKREGSGRLSGEGNGWLSPLFLDRYLLLQDQVVAVDAKDTGVVGIQEEQIEEI